MKQLILKYKNYLFVLAGILTLIFLFLSKKSPPFPQVLLFSPADNSVSIDLRVNPAYEFNMPVLLSDLTLTTTPSLNFQLSQPKANMLLATHSLAFQPSTTYTFTLSWQGHVLQTHSFTTLKSQEDPLLIQNMKDELARDYPLAQKLPYTTQQYRVVYSAPMILEITLKNPNLTSQEAIDEVKAWVASQGGNVSAHKFIVATP